MSAGLRGVRVVLSYSDPMARSTEDGQVVTPGHVGAIYQAKGARYVGMTGPRWQHLDARGRTVADRGLSKIRNGERGWEAAAQGLVARGAPGRLLHEPPVSWLERALRDGPFRRVRHPGQHVYLFAPDGTSNSLPTARPARPYPKRG